MAIKRKSRAGKTRPTGYAGDSAGSLSFGVVALVIAGFFIQSGQVASLSGGEGDVAGFIGLVLGVAGLVGVGQGVRMLAGNLDRVLHSRLGPPS